MIGLIKFVWLIVFILAGLINLYYGTWWGATVAFIAAFILIIKSE